MSTTTVIVFIVSMIFSVGFLVLIIFLVPMINQLKALLGDFEKTSAEIRELTKNFQTTTDKINNEIDKADAMMNSSKRIVDTVAYSVESINRSVMAKSAGLMSIIPLVKFGFKYLKKNKGGK